MRKRLSISSSRKSNRESPTVKHCYEAMKRTLQKRNIRINSINFSEMERTIILDKDSAELNLTVMRNAPMGPEEAKEPATSKEQASPKEPATAKEPHTK